MDHLLLPDGANPIEVPYFCTEEYDNFGFSTYPERKGWDKTRLLEHGDAGGRTEAETASFLQTWLYFGFLHDALGVSGVRVRTSDFMRLEASGRSLVTTKMLPEKLSEWEDSELNQQGEDPASEASTTARPVAYHSVMSELVKWSDRYLVPRKENVTGSETGFSTPLPEGVSLFHSYPYGVSEQHCGADVGSIQAWVIIFPTCSEPWTHV
jgi:hypothetical protein